MPERIRFATLLAFALIGLGAWRVFAIVGAAPLLGYANQFDMRRTSACVGLWPVVADEARLQAHPETPIARYVRGERRADECYWSSELLFVAPVAATLAPGETVDLRVIGAVKGASLILIGLAIGTMFRRRPAIALVHGILFALVVCDPIVTLWLNTLYTEFAALLFAYASVALVVSIGAPEMPAQAPSRIQMTALVASLAGLGLSRQQHLWLPALLVLPLAITLWPRAHRSAIVLIAVAGAIAFVQAELVERHPTIARANSADVIFGAILPASEDQAATARKLNLPERCLRSIDSSWYVPMGETPESSCPEVFEVRKRHLAALAFSEPATLLRAALRAIPQLQDWRLGFMGAVEGLRYGNSDSVRGVAGGLASSIAPVVAALPALAFMQVLAASGAIFVASAWVCIIAARSRPSSPLALTLYALTAVAWYAIVSSVFGDGYVELARHAQLADVALYAAVVVLVTAVFAPPLRAAAGERRRGTAPAAFILLALGAGLLSAQPLRRAMETVPMAFGVVDLPARNVVAPDGVEFSGWAVDPQEVDRVELVVDGKRTIAAHYGLPYLGARGEPLALYFPGYPKTADAGFTAHVPADALANGRADVRTVVVNKAGVRTEIDRRQLIVGAR